MSNNTSQARVADIIRDARMPVTMSTMEWFEALHEAGAVIHDPDGGVRLDPKVRAVIAAMHHVLAGGEVALEVTREGDETFARLEAVAERALAETLRANQLRDPDMEQVPYLP